MPCAWASRRPRTAGAPAMAESAAAPAVLLTPDTAAARAIADQPFDLTRPPLLRVAAIGTDDTAGELLLAAHHLIVDAVSWSILLEDLAQLLRDPTTAALAPPSTSLARCGEALASSASSSTALAELPYWRDALTREVSPLPLAAAAAPDLVAGEATVTVRLDRETTGSPPRRGAAPRPHPRPGAAAGCAWPDAQPVDAGPIAQALARRPRPRSARRGGGSRPGRRLVHEPLPLGTHLARQRRAGSALARGQGAAARRSPPRHRLRHAAPCRHRRRAP